MVVAMWAGTFAGAQGDAIQVQAIAQPPRYEKVNIMPGVVADSGRAWHGGGSVACHAWGATTHCRHYY